MKKIALFAVAMLVVSITSLVAQTFTVLHSFTGSSDGSGPQSGLLLSGNTLYGTTISGGTNNSGTMFSVNTDGSSFTVLHTISTPAEGLGPSSLILSGNTFFATSNQGGSNYEGTVFSAVIGNGSFTTLHTFTGLDGATPSAGLVLADDRLYGTTEYGGSNNAGVVFSIGTNGSGFTVIHNFTTMGFSPHTNSDGGVPQAGLCLSGDTLYGTASNGGTNASGTVFSINTDGTVFTTLHNFTGGSDGGYPQAGLILSGGRLYGTTRSGGTNDTGTVFSMNTNGAGFTVLHSFAPVNYTGTNWDGAFPEAELVLSGDTLFGTAYQGGANQRGTVFMLNTNGAGFITLHHFTGGSDGAYPQSGLIFSGNTLYGAAFIGGTNNGKGTVYGLTILPGISSLSLAGTNLVINATNGLEGHIYTLLVATNVTLPISQWIPVATNVLNSSGNFTITATNAVNATALQQFYILQVQ
jgi:uncharacterized repeat protein (TIGR03803 family)